MCGHFTSLFNKGKSDISSLCRSVDRCWSSTRKTPSSMALHPGLRRHSGVPLLVIAKNQGPPRHAHGGEALRPPAESYVTEAIRAGAPRMA